ncbi:solute carrier family 46 member 2 isoform X2 [Syngnathus typhle]|uniref:solute carrier family 46 member 2 isoform X2 n=1 Tax=Syngnathus typhle TaxID=161592 RepID=UPI002A6B70AA|nr:solute carrier family 46 member 2 isoform X2 [Syngnathus typhle]
MTTWSWCQSAFGVVHRVEPLVVLEQLGTSLFDTALLMVVKDRCANATEDDQQRTMSDFYMVYNLIVQLMPIVPALLLAKVGDRGWRRVPIVVPLCGYLVSTVALLHVVLLRLPIQVMFAAAVLLGTSGGFCAYWPGVMTLVSLGSKAESRSKVRQVSSEQEESSPLLPHSDNGPPEMLTRKNTVNVILLFSAAILYGSSVGGAIEILGIFVIKEPLHWNVNQVGYGNAAGFVIFLTSFLGALAFRRYVSDVTLILIGMISFATGIYFMSLVTTSYMFYLSRSLTLFALIPLPTIRSLLSQQVSTPLCGITLTVLQLVLRFAALAYIPAFTKLYQRTLGWFPGFVFTVSSILAVLGMFPISVIAWRWSQPISSEETTETRHEDVED